MQYSWPTPSTKEYICLPFIMLFISCNIFSLLTGGGGGGEDKKMGVISIFGFFCYSCMTALSIDDSYSSLPLSFGRSKPPLSSICLSVCLSICVCVILFSSSLPFLLLSLHFSFYIISLPSSFFVF